jgi:hypothetical protein
VRYGVGTVALYRLDAWHRGTQPTPGRRRVHQHLIWRRDDAEWIQWQSFPRPLSAMPTRYMAGLSVVQVSGDDIFTFFSRACMYPLGSSIALY